MDFDAETDVAASRGIGEFMNVAHEGLLILLLALGWAFPLARQGHAVAALCGAVAIAFGYALFLAAEFLMLLRHGVDVPSLRPTTMSWIAVSCWSDSRGMAVGPHATSEWLRNGSANVS